jgi:16S rRNA (uracil1498-N3)-methyltransferase
MHTYFYDGDLNGQVVLSQEESNHAVKVMRSKVGDRVMLINGKGVKAVGSIVDAHHKRCSVSIEQLEEEAMTGPKVIVAISPTKSNDRIEFFLEKATEIGVDGVIPLMAQNNERTKVNMDRWKKVIISAVKQSKRFWMPELFEPMKMSQLLNEDWSGSVKLIAYCEDLPEENVVNYASHVEDKLLLIGPEGDFTKEEVEQCEGAGFHRVNLGKNRLRTETAGIVGVTLLKN